MTAPVRAGTSLLRSLSVRQAIGLSVYVVTGSTLGPHAGAVAALGLIVVPTGAVVVPGFAERLAVWLRAFDRHGSEGASEVVGG